MTVRKRVFGVFSVAFLHEALLDEARLRVDLSDRGCGASNPEASGFDSIWSDALQMIRQTSSPFSRIQIEPFGMDVVDGDRMLFELRSGKVQSNSRDPLQLRNGVQVRTANGYLLRCDRALLTDGWSISARGGYALFERAGTALESGSEAAFRLDPRGDLRPVPTAPGRDSGVPPPAPAS